MTETNYTKPVNQQLLSRREALHHWADGLFFDMPVEALVLFYAEAVEACEKKGRRLERLKRDSPSYATAEALFFLSDDVRAMLAGELYRRTGGDRCAG